MFRSLLIANRGEIALRVVRACRELGIRSVVAHSEADRGAPWIEAADASVCIGPARSGDSYLDGRAVLLAAEQAECQALHPGYGFLSENARFAARCEQSGVTFVGPTAAAIRGMGDKAVARRTMETLGVPTLPGSAGELVDVDHARSVADEVGFPVLLKAVAGGGGKGMRRCDDRASLERGFEEASIEAGKAFGNAALYLEKFLSSARHIEFQVLVDGFGRGVHLGERDCSIQRKHQKLVEEAPSPVVNDEVRASLGERVASACAAAGYRGAGTVEFLRDPDGHYYFMEMNARLQVEHPVTEMVYDVDLVAEQLRIAANVPLADDLGGAPRRHAMEFRINAEDPSDGFRPDPGTIERVTPPPEAIGEARVRWDSAVADGYRIPPHYDSMIGKLIVAAADREATLAAAREALASLSIEGVRTTIPFHRALLDEPAFVAGDFDIHFLQESDLLTRIAGEG